MPITPETINVEITPKGDRPVLYFSQYDNGRPFVCNLLWEGEAYEPTDIDIELHVRKVDGNIVSITPDSVSTNAVSFFSTEQMCACFGKNIGELVLKDGDDVIATKDIDIIVQRDVFQGGIDSASEIANLTTQIEQITEQVIGNDYYNKTEVDGLLDDKADVTDLPDMSNYYTKTATDNLLNNKADISDLPDMSQYYTKTQTDEIIIGILPTGTASGSVATFTTSLELPIESLTLDVNATQEAGTPTPATLKNFSGWNSVTLNANGVTEIINLGGTYYGGHVKQDKDGHREFVVTSAFDSYDLTNINPAATQSGFDRWALTLSNVSTAGGSSQGKKCNATNIYNYSTSYNEHFYIAGDSVRFYFEENTMRDKVVEFLYPLETPITIDLPDGQPITTISGENNISCDTGDTTVKYKQTIDEAIASLQALILSI